MHSDSFVTAPTLSNGDINDDEWRFLTPRHPQELGTESIPVIVVTAVVIFSLVTSSFTFCFF